MDSPFPSLLSSEEFDSRLETIKAKERTKERHLCDAEQLVESIAALSRSFPHVTKRIEALWGSPELSAYLSSLVMETTRRCGAKRRGFPAQAMHHVLKIHNIHFRSTGKALPHPWNHRNK